MLSILLRKPLHPLWTADHYGRVGGCDPCFLKWIFTLLLALSLHMNVLLGEAEQLLRTSNLT